VVVEVVFPMLMLGQVGVGLVGFLLTQMQHLHPAQHTQSQLVQVAQAVQHQILQQALALVVLILCLQE
jgi:hypothetical protein